MRTLIGVADMLHGTLLLGDTGARATAPRAALLREYLGIVLYRRRR